MKLVILLGITAVYKQKYRVEDQLINKVQLCEFLLRRHGQATRILNIETWKQMFHAQCPQKQITVLFLFALGFLACNDSVRLCPTSTLILCYYIKLERYLKKFEWHNCPWILVFYKILYFDRGDLEIGTIYCQVCEIGKKANYLKYLQAHPLPYFGMLQFGFELYICTLKASELAAILYLSNSLIVYVM